MQLVSFPGSPHVQTKSWMVLRNEAIDALKLMHITQSGFYTGTICT